MKNHNNLETLTALLFVLLFKSFVDSVFLAIMCFLLKKARLVFIFEKPFLENGLESLLIFILF